MEEVTMGTTLAYITLVVVLIVVLALVAYLLLIIKALRGTNESLGQLAAGLSQIVEDTQPLPQKMTTINGALNQLLEGLLAVNNNLAAVARLLKQ
jgi:predicted PurR-regulated permease PerM